MPELAEVEYFRKRWDAGIGKNVLAVQLHGENRIFRGATSVNWSTSLVRQRLLRSVARGKQMLFVFSSDNWLGIHLGMSGNLRAEPSEFRTRKTRSPRARAKIARAGLSRRAAVWSGSFPSRKKGAGVVDGKRAGNSFAGIHQAHNGRVR